MHELTIKSEEVFTVGGLNRGDMDLIYSALSIQCDNLKQPTLNKSLRLVELFK